MDAGELTPARSKKPTSPYLVLLLGKSEAFTKFLMGVGLDGFNPSLHMS